MARRLDDEQAELLSEAEEILARRDAERSAAAAERARLKEQLETRAVEIVELESRLEEDAQERARLEARVRDLEAEVRRLLEAKEALEEIEATINRRS